MNAVMKNLFENIFWPAAAGNVFWSFLSLFVARLNWPMPGEPRIDLADIAPSLLILLVLSVYLAVGGLRLKAEKGALSPTYWVFEFLHLMSLTAAAISALVNPPVLYSLLITYYVVTILGALAGATRLPGDERDMTCSIIGINVAGLAIIVVAQFAGLPGLWPYALSFTVALALWLTVRRHDLATIAGRL